MRVLLVEDEERMAGVVARGLREETHSVVVARDGIDGIDLAAAHEFDVVLLDVMLPRLDGIEVVRRLRGSGNQTPIVMLTARDAVHDIVRGLDCGADDYVTKPFSFEELLARIRAAVRHRPASRSTVITVGELVLDPAKRSVTRAGDAISLSATEFRLLEFLMRRAGRVIERGVIIEAVWGLGSDVGENTLEAFISFLRNKVDRPYGDQLIRTVRGVGYGICAGEP